MVSEETRREVYDLANGKCENCGRMHAYFTISQAIQGLSTWEWHHRYFKSEYKGEDRDESWNGAVLCCDSIRDCHKQGKEAVHGGNVYLNRKLKLEADKRRPKNHRHGGVHRDLLNRRKVGRELYKKAVQNFMFNNGGLTPSQLMYQKKKQWIEKNRKNN